MQPVEKNTLEKIPFVIAKFLRLSDPEIYTGHCLLRASAKIMTEAGADPMMDVEPLQLQKNIWKKKWVLAPSESEVRSHKSETLPLECIQVAQQRIFLIPNL